MASPLGSPVLVVVGGNVVIAAQGESLLSLLSLSRDGDNLVAAERLGEDDTEMPQTTETQDGDLLARAGLPVLQGRPHGDATTEHGGSIFRSQALGELEDEVGGRAVEESVATLGLVAVAMGRVVCLDQTGAVGLEAVLTLVALAITLQARVGLGANTDNVADLDVALGLGADANGDTDDFVSDNEGVLGAALEREKDS